MLSAVEVLLHPTAYDISHNEYIDIFEDPHLAHYSYDELCEGILKDGAYSCMLAVACTNSVIGNGIMPYCSPTAVPKLLSNPLTKEVRGRGLKEDYQVTRRKYFSVTDLYRLFREVNSSHTFQGVIRSRDLRCCSEEEMVEELSGVTHARRIKVRRGEDKIRTDTVVLTFDSPKPPSRIRAGYLTLNVICTSRSRCAVISANAMATARASVRNLLLYVLDVARVVMSNVIVRLTPRGDYAASSKTCPKFFEEHAIVRYKTENGGTFQQARKAVVVEIHRTISTRTSTNALKSQLRTKPAALLKDGGRSAPSAPPKGKKAQKDSPALSPQRAAESEIAAKHRAEKSKRQEAPRETLFLLLWRWMLRILYPQSGGIPPPPSPRGPPPPLWSALPPPPNPNPLQISSAARGGETPRSSAFPLASLPPQPRSPCDGGGKGY
ncbi:RNA-directed DNA polymerase from mobile element jockey [Plakobranchus ocellatus]|uniref:RNA-directed DNA polymerase from mobile element jockey n=1 Tax=Plakobranchus ocellatus TaxID=259542 RepID=A0AAV3YGU0_9GAST|nr:RNA-directed DNA polymerase from mobile element jockey [Plakobranchus ocellatus]